MREKPLPITRLGKVLRLSGGAGVALTLGLLLAYVGRAPGPPEPRELYETVVRHLEACRAEDFPLAYHAAASETQERLSLVQFERKLRADWGAVARAHHVELGGAGTVRGNRERATVDMLFVLNARGEVIVRRYFLVREDGAWKVDRSEFTAGWPQGPRVRLGGRAV